MYYDNGLLEFLQSHGITQSGLSLGSRISNVTISKVCRKKLSPSKTLIGKISQYLIKETNCSPDDLKKILPPYVAVKKENVEIKKEKIVIKDIEEKEEGKNKKEKVVKEKVVKEKEVIEKEVKEKVKTDDKEVVEETEIKKEKVATKKPKVKSEE
jgi:transcriptional regulator with XRE-family HTH domain